MRAREGAAPERRSWRRPEEDSAGHPRGQQRHGHVRQRARAARDVGPVAPARDPDDDSRAVEREPRHEPRAARVLRVPLVAHGGVGRAASIAFTDGTVIGAVLDRNGLRPSRYCVTKDDLVIMASEAGVLDSRPRSPVKERLSPGKIFLVDTAQGRIVDDEEIKGALAAEHPYGEWLTTHLVDIDDLPPAPAEQPEHATVFSRQQSFGYTQEDLRLLSRRWRMTGEEPVGSMGTDTALAVLSDRPRLLYDYFKQLFAQVTNPPLDAIREELVTSMGSTIGPERNLLKPEPESCRQIHIKYPIIDNEQVAKLRHLPPHGRFARRRSRCYSTRRAAARPRAGDGRSSAAGRARRSRPGSTSSSCPTAASIARMAPIPSLLATAGVHHHLVREGTRTRCGSSIESGDAREVHHSRCSSATAPARSTRTSRSRRIDDMIRQGMLAGHRPREGGRALHQGAQQGHPQGDVEDGDLDAAELLRRADLRSDRAPPGVRRPVLHAHDVTHRRHQHRRHRRGSRGAGTRARSAGSPLRPRGTRRRRRVPVAPGRGVSPLQPRDRVQAAARDPHRAVRDLQAVHAGRERRRPSIGPRCGDCSG